MSNATQNNNAIQNGRATQNGGTTQKKNPADGLERYIDSLTEPQWLGDVRRAALERFREMAWPTMQDEEFRRSDVSSYDFDDWAVVPETGRPAEVENPVGLSGTLTFDGAKAQRFSLAPELSSKGVMFLSFEDVAAGKLPENVAQAVARALQRGLATADNRLSVWHYVTMSHGVVLYVPRFLELSDPFMITFDDAGDGVLRSPEIVVVADTGARFSVLHRSRNAEEGEVLYTEGVDIEVGDGGKVEYFLLQNVNIDSTYFSNAVGSLGRDATLHVYSAVFGGLLSKYRLDGLMNGEGSDAFLGGVYFPHEDQHVDLRTVQRHIKPKGHSLTLYKGAVSDESHSVYQGLISVDHDALNTDAYLTNNNLILGNDAEADSIPTLQINTDEVRCSHGSTTGKLDERHVFYLASRGYSPEEARRLLIEGYFAEVTGHFPEAAREEINAIVENRIPLDV